MAAATRHDTSNDDGDRWVGRALAGRYEVQAPLGAGGMGVVYRAMQRSVLRPVAVKILCADAGETDERFVHRFRNEALLASRLSHPNTVTVFDFGVEACGSLFIAMELVDGQSLGAVLQAETALGWHRATRIASQIADSLFDAHQAGIVHRDLKPDNVMLTQVAGRPDHVKVLDFGIATILAPDDAIRRVTRPNEVFGTPEYMAPEQGTGDACTHRTDIYSLGVMLFEMLSGRRPFQGATPMGTLLAHVHEPLPPLTSARGDLPLRLETLVLKMLARDPVDRPDTMGDVSRALRRVLRNSGTGFAPVAQTDELADPSSRTTPRVSSPRLESVTPPPRHRTRAARPDARVVGARCDVATSLAAIDGVIGEVGQAVRALAELGVEDARTPHELFDPTLARSVSDVVNAALVGRTRRRVERLDRAIVMVGFDSVRHAALLATVLRLFHALDRRGADGGDVRAHALVAAATAMAVAPHAERIEAAVAAVGAWLGRALVAAAMPEQWRTFCERARTESPARLESEIFGAPLVILGQRALDGYEWPAPDGPAVSLGLALADEAMLAIPAEWPERAARALSAVDAGELEIRDVGTLAQRLTAFGEMLAGLCEVARVRPQHRRATRLAAVMTTPLVRLAPAAVEVRPRLVRGVTERLQQGVRNMDRALAGRFSERGLALDVLKFCSGALDASLALYVRAQRGGQGLAALYGLGRTARKVRPRFKLPLVDDCVWPPMAVDWFNEVLQGRSRVASAVRRMPRVEARLPGCFEHCDDASWTVVVFRGERPGFAYFGWQDERAPDETTRGALELVARRLEHAFDNA